MLALLLLAACSGGPVNVVWSGFEYRWDLLSHRVSYISAMTEDDGGASMGLVGGDWSTGEVFSDSGLYRMRMSRIAAKDLMVVHGQTELMVGPDGVASASESYQDDELAAMSQHIVLLRGFVLNTDVDQTEDYPLDDYDPAYGYTSRGFGMGVGAPSVSGDAVSFDVSGAVRWGPQDREDVNAAIPYATTGLTVGWTIIGFDGASSDQTVSATLDYEHAPPNSVQYPLGQGDLDLNLTSDYDVGFPGIRAFDLDVSDQDGTDEGDYLRSFGVELVRTEETESDFIGYASADASNASVIEYMKDRLTATVDVSWVGLAGGRAIVDEQVLSGTHATGTLDVPAP